MSKKILLLLALFTSTLAYSQKKDFAAWYTLAGRYEITKKIKLDISEELRTISNASISDQFFTDLGISYKFNKYVSLGGYYRFIKKREKDDNFHTRNRFYGELQLSFPFKQFELEYRFRFQRQVNEYFEDIEDDKPILYNRHKIELSYNIPNFKLTPSFSYERFYRLKYVNSYFADNVRYGIGLNYKFNKKHLVSVSYLINKDLYPKEKYLYILSLGYKFTFK